MLEYTIDDADTLLKKNLDAAVKSLEQVEDDLGFLRDQTTTIEVSILSKKHNTMLESYIIGVLGQVLWKRNCIFFLFFFTKLFLHCG